MSDINQDDIDKLLQDALVGGGDPPAPAPASEEPPAAQPALEDMAGAASQDDIDALFAAVGNDPEPVAPAAAPAPEPEPAPPESASEEPAMDLSGIANQDDIDALFSAVDAEAAAPVPAPEAPESGAEPDDADLSGVASQDDIDALFSTVGDTPAGEDFSPDAEPADGPVDQDDINDLFESQLAEAEAQADLEAAQADNDLDALLSSIADEDEETPGTASAAPAEAMPPPPAVSDQQAASSTTVVEDIDMDELLRQVAEAAPPPPPPKPAPEEPPIGADTAVLSPDVSAALASAQTPPAAPAPTLPPSPPSPPAGDMLASMPPPAAPVGARREFSVLYGAGEVESVANQISALLNSMSEKAHGYMQAWIAADSEAKELRARALAEERRRISLESEKSALAQQLDELRGRLGEAEGAKVAAEESRRTLDASYQAKVRELESRVTLLASEAESLKDELTRARNQATGVDIESRRARFEVDRLKNEVESERMERLRIQRALENREKEMQALQAQSSGQASSLFIDELHRLVRRLESELDNRSSGAHEALKQLDRLETTDSMVPVVANLRASLLQALGQDSDADDALKSLGREASGIKGPAAVAPERAEMVSFETALSTYNLVGAVDVAGALLREASATPSSLMKKIYQCPALRRPEVADRLPELARLLEGLRTIQEANDRSRGSESGESEVFYVHMFDFLHNLVKLKVINRMSGDIWRIFLDLRGRFSFVTSDKQWAEYRDNTLGGTGRP